MKNRLQPHSALIALLIIIGTLAGLYAAYKRFHIEESNKRVEIALEWQEVTLLAQASNKPVDEILQTLKANHVSTIVISEDTITTLEQSGVIHPGHAGNSDSPNVPFVQVDSDSSLNRILSALVLHGIPEVNASLIKKFPNSATAFAHTNSSSTHRVVYPLFLYAVDYLNLRTMGLGLPPEAVEQVSKSGMNIAGRISNFTGVNETSARQSLENLKKQGASTVVFNGEEVLGYRGLEKNVAEMFKKSQTAASGLEATIPIYGAVEFGKQKGDEKLSNNLLGDYVRVHSIQAAEMGQLDEEEAVDRFVRAAKERNIRFCYVRLLTFAGANPLNDNIRYLNKIARGMAQGRSLTGGGLGFGAARRYPDTGIPSLMYALVALGTAAGLVWVLQILIPIPIRIQVGLLLIFSVTFCGLALFGETGRKIVAFLAGVSFPAIACLLAFPNLKTNIYGSQIVQSANYQPVLSPINCLIVAVKSIGIASAITALGIIQVIGLLATRPFMMHASQFLGIKAQHAVPLLFVGFAAIVGGVALPGETWLNWKVRVSTRLMSIFRSPLQVGMLLIGIVAMAGLVLVIARTGNDAGVGVSSTELRIRDMLDRILPVRPRTKEFLIGHPAFILGIAWWLRGRKRLALPTFVVGSLGQVSLLNTFCHIHTPLIISAWRDALGLIFGVLIGAALFLAFEIFLAKPSPDIKMETGK